MAKRQRKGGRRKGKSRPRGTVPRPMTLEETSSQGVNQYGVVGFNQFKITRVPMRLVVTGVSSDGSGNISQVIGINNPSNTTNWASYGALYDHYRVRKVVIHMIPNDPTATFRPLYVVTDFDATSASSLTSADACMQYESTRIYDVQHPFVHKVINPGLVVTNQPKGNWIDIASPNSTAIVALMAFSLTPSTVYMAGYTVEWDVEFRATR